MSNKKFETIVRAVRGVTFVFLVFFSTYFGTIFILTPILPVFLFAPTFARSYTDPVIWVWKLYCVAIYEVLFQTKVSIYGDIPSNEAATLMIMNHRTRFDWLYLFSYQVRHASMRRYIISLKNILKFMPGIGWAMQLAGYIFLDRKWEDDQNTISRSLKVFKELNYKPQILLFPEGTDFTQNTKRNSDRYAEKNNLTKYEYVLQPRTTGFTHFVQEMKKGDMLEYITDITIAYPGSIPQNEADIVKGNFPSEIQFLLKKYPNSLIPSHKDDLHNWCMERWSEKEETLKNFYEKKSFERDSKQLHTNESLVNGLFVYAWVLWSSFHLLVVYLLWSYPYLWVYVFLCTVFYVSVSKYTPGLGLLIASTFNV